MVLFDIPAPSVHSLLNAPTAMYRNVQKHLVDGSLALDVTNNLLIELAVSGGTHG